MKYTEINSKAWDSIVAEGCEWTEPISHENYERSVNGKLELFGRHQNLYLKIGGKEDKRFKNIVFGLLWWSTDTYSGGKMCSVHLL